MDKRGLIIKVSLSGQVILLSMSGQLWIGDGAVTLRSTVRYLLDNGYRVFVFNLADLSFCDSSGLGEIVSCYTAIHNYGGFLKFTGIHGKVEQHFHVTRLDTAFEIFAVEDQALQAANESARILTQIANLKSQTE